MTQDREEVSMQVRGSLTMPPHSPVLHVVVGHGLELYFLNSVRSVFAQAPYDDVLVVDNGTAQPKLTSSLRALVTEHERAVLAVRQPDRTAPLNLKVGSLYAAYEEIFSEAISAGYEFLHLIQADAQMMWWDSSILAIARDIYRVEPKCVNISTFAVTRDLRLGTDLVDVGSGGYLYLSRYGLTDTGLFNLDRWRRDSMAFQGSERAHSKYYLDRGYVVVLHPKPSVAQIPWPAVVRQGITIGSQIDGGQQFLLRRLDRYPDQRPGEQLVYLEDIAIPWGWKCLTPMLPVGFDGLAYAVRRLQAARADGIRAAIPRHETRGLDVANPRGTRVPKPRLARQLLVSRVVRHLGPSSVSRMSNIVNRARCRALAWCRRSPVIR